MTTKTILFENSGYADADIFFDDFSHGNNELQVRGE